ncbi:MAG: CoA-binding protein [Acidobacteriota bacterium]
MKSIAIVGASTDRSKFGNKCVRAYQHEGWEVVPINPKGGEIEGVEAAVSLADARPTDRIALYLAPNLLRPLLPAIAERESPEGVYFNPGTWTPELLAEAKEMGILVRQACAIVAIGLSPSQFP